MLIRPGIVVIKLTSKKKQAIRRKLYSLQNVVQIKKIERPSYPILKLIRLSGVIPEIP